MALRSRRPWIEKKTLARNADGEEDEEEVEEVSVFCIKRKKSPAGQGGRCVEVSVVESKKSPARQGGRCVEAAPVRGGGVHPVLRSVNGKKKTSWLLFIS